jgi:hypothetical protein
VGRASISQTKTALRDTGEEREACLPTPGGFLQWHSETSVNMISLYSRTVEQDGDTRRARVTEHHICACWSHAGWTTPCH